MAVTRRSKSVAESESLRAELEKLKQSRLAEAEAIRYAKRWEKCQKAKGDLIAFTELMMPEPSDPENSEKSRYQPVKHHRIIAAAMEEIEASRYTKIIITLPPRSGKTTLISNNFVPWFMGRNPYKSVILASYNETLACDIGRAVRDGMQSPPYVEIFPEVQLKPGSAASDRLETRQGGLAVFTGMGGSLTGRGGDVLIIDDPTKDAQEACSEAFRRSQWEWYTKVFITRRMTDKSGIVIVTCMAGDTPVLMAEGCEKALREIHPGDRVATYRNGSISASRVVNWINHGPDFVFEIRMKSGIRVRANARHPFLTKHGDTRQWQRTATLRRGSIILRVTTENGRGFHVRQQVAESRPNAEVCACPTTTNPGGTLRIALRPSTPFLDAQRAFGIATGLTLPNTTDFLPSSEDFAPSVSVHRQKQIPAPIGAGSCALTTATIPSGSGDFSATIATLQWDMERQRKCCQPPRITYEIVEDEVCEVVGLGFEDVFDIEVEETGNFIANGLVSHNTRWHEDDIVGRLTDPESDFYQFEEAKQWKILNLAALADEDDPMGRASGESLWPERFSVDYYESIRLVDPKGFSALYQGRPTPEDGEFFKEETLRTYLPGDLLNPNGTKKALRYYCASDHAVSTKQTRDATALIPAGIDEHGCLWVLPDVWWQRQETDRTVEAMLNLMAKFKPLLWWAERGHISKSIGPFLRKRMLERSIFCAVDEMTPVADKLTRAQAIQARCAMGLVRFPAFAPWWGRALSELLSFPNGKHDDFVDALAWLGLGLAKQIPATRQVPVSSREPKVGTIQWVKWAASEENRARHYAGTRGF